MSRVPISRRSFLLSAAATGLAAPALGKSTRVSANEEVRVAILGAGWRGGQLAEVFSKAKGCRLVAFADPDETLSKEFGSKYLSLIHI